VTLGGVPDHWHYALQGLLPNAGTVTLTGADAVTFFDLIRNVTDNPPKGDVMRTISLYQQIVGEHKAECEQVAYERRLRVEREVNEAEAEAYEMNLRCHTAIQLDHHRTAPF